MLWSYSQAPDGHIISINCDRECVVNKEAECINECPLKRETEKKDHSNLKVLNPQYIIDRWK